jgi:hypothetical protein
MTLRKSINGTFMWPRKNFIAGLQLLLKGLSSKNISEANIPIPYLYFTGFIFGFREVIDPAETYFCDFRNNFLGAYDAKCETAWGSESGH